ncbi:hypothetical protein LOK49_LG08G01239 [Camellia lanceoleosa]|uniref:Uncharacterized protein n=1 Tax=Camellia lanceoleosa TaxID=1840588 RepID=A0ACC0GQB0_9ERIC|nr:hypothetical protein LOK49_LG08G01239 [Camellia lanceoleosa]
MAQWQETREDVDGQQKQRKASLPVRLAGGSDGSICDHRAVKVCEVGGIIGKILKGNFKLRGQRREQVYIPVSAFGDGWEGVALVIDGFGLCVAKASRPIGFRKVSSTFAAECESVGVVRSEVEVEVDWFRILDRSLVGKLGGLGGKGLSFATISDWVARWWKHSGKVDVRPLGDKAFLFVLSSRGEAEAPLRRRWTVEGCDLLLEWWSPLALCTPAKTSRPEKSVWIWLMGLPIYL